MSPSANSSRPRRWSRLVPRKRRSLSSTRWWPCWPWGAMGRRRKKPRKLLGSFAEYATLLLLTATAQWRSAEKPCDRCGRPPGTSSWVKAPAITIAAGATAARGAVAASDQILKQAVLSEGGPNARWFVQARLLLAVASGHRIGPPDRWILRDTTGGGLLAGGMWAAIAGDTLTARHRLAKLREQDPVELRRLGEVPPSWRPGSKHEEGVGRGSPGSWAPLPRRGEYDGADPDQVSSLATRWLVADAYRQLGELDSAAAYFELIESTRLPFQPSGSARPGISLRRTSTRPTVPSASPARSGGAALACFSWRRSSRRILRSRVS